MQSGGYRPTLISRESWLLCNARFGGAEREPCADLVQEELVSVRAYLINRASQGLSAVLRQHC